MPAPSRLFGTWVGLGWGVTVANCLHVLWTTSALSCSKTPVYVQVWQGVFSRVGHFPLPATGNAVELRSLEVWLPVHRQSEAFPWEECEGSPHLLFLLLLPLFLVPSSSSVVPSKAQLQIWACLLQGSKNEMKAFQWHGSEATVNHLCSKHFEFHV